MKYLRKESPFIISSIKVYTHYSFYVAIVIIIDALILYSSSTAFIII